nr:MAG TPA: hypothetical protein [Caudoviricetes sp.]
MSEAVLVTLIGSGLSLIGVVFTNSQSNKKIESTLDKKQAVTDEKITELTREVREHNNFAKRMPVVELQIKNIEEKLKHLEER